ncbi:MAG TPA: LPXTG cell wall anchor domain-containing protein [Pseudonocardiaceae bacterium]|nr:LPXTG cell wall anchor domain-containing protein [Pseudonocardiaceae bacterium]
MYKVPGAGGAVGAGAGTLAFTGANVTGWIVFGAILLVAGVLAVVAGRRRQHRLATSDDPIAG